MITSGEVSTPGTKSTAMPAGAGVPAPSASQPTVPVMPVPRDTVSVNDTRKAIEAAGKVVAFTIGSMAVAGLTALTGSPLLSGAVYLAGAAIGSRVYGPAVIQRYPALGKVGGILAGAALGLGTAWLMEGSGVSLPQAITEGAASGAALGGYHGLMNQE